MSERTNFFIVGIGASAGGLKALQKLFSELPDKNPAAFVIIQHLSPDFESMMNELLAKYTSMPIVKVIRATKVQPNHVYLMSPKQNLELVNGELKPVTPDDQRTLNLPIDIFFKSLAQERKTRSVGVVLSGTGTDGSRGIKTIKEQGGIVVVQTPESAQFDGMPNAAIISGATDFVLDLPEMAQELQRIINHTPKIAETVKDLPTNDQEYIASILHLIKQGTKIDFSLYKEATVLRRLEKRMHIVNVNTLKDYHDILTSNSIEVERLSDEFLIGVSSFFRDQQPWEVFKEQVMSAIIEKFDENRPIRVWVAGCSTGEEAYTIGMVIDNYLHENNISFDYKIFGSDIDKQAIYSAGTGRFSSNSADSIPPEYLKRYFDKAGSAYQTKKFFRDHFVFASQNIISDPPFIRMDIVSCRNVLIYFKPEVQQKALANFHYALNKSGFLVLGKSENIGHLMPFFTPIGKRTNIFQNRVASEGRNYFIGHSKDLRKGPTNYTKAVKKASTFNKPVIKDLISEAFDEAAVLVDANHRILHAQGDIDRFFHFPKNNLQMQLDDVLGKDEYLLIKGGIRDALNRKKSVYYHDVSFGKGRRKRVIDLRFKAIQAPSFQKRIVYVEFRNERKLPKEQQPSSAISGDNSRRFNLLEKEVDEKQRLIQTLREELDSHSEELQTTNEELLASNEELQSSNEELQSVNEELYTLNAELEEKVKEVTQANDDIVNLLNSTQIATIFVDHNYLIRRLTPNISDIINISESDIGRSIDHFTTKLEDVSLTTLTREVMETNHPLEREVELASEKCCYLMRILPYRESDETINGLVITFVDISEIKEAQLEVRNARAFAENIVDTVIDPLLVLDNQLKIISANPAFYTTFQTSQEKTTEQYIYEVADGQWNQPDLRKLLEESITQNSTISDYQIGGHFPNIGYRTLSLNAVVIPQDGNTPGLILLIIRDITEKERRRQQLQETAERLNLVIESSKIGIWEWNTKTNVVSGDKRLRELFDLPSEGPLEFKQIASRVHPEDLPLVSHALEQSLQGFQPYFADFRIIGDNGETKYLIGRGNMLKNEDGKPYKMLGINLDVSEQRQAEEESTQYGKLLEESYNEIYIFAADTLHFVKVNRGARQNLGYTMAEMQSLTPLDIKPGFSSESFTKLIEPLRNEEVETVNFETAHLRKNGSQYNVLVNLQLSTFRGQEVFIAIIQDTTEQSKSRTQLQKSEERLAVAVYGTSDAIWDWPDIQEDQVWRSPRFYELIGYEEHEVPSTTSSFRDLVHPNDIEVLRKAVDNHIHSDKPFDITIRVKHKTQGYRWFRNKGKVVQNENESPIRMAGAISDIHSQKLAENRLKKTNRDLRIANEYLDNFVFTAAHDLRAPVANLKSLSTLLQSESGHDSRVVEKIDQSIERLERVLKGIIYILDIQQSGDEEHQQLEFETMLQKASNEIATELEQSNVAIEYDFKVASIQYIEYYLVSVIKNLLSNAIEYSDEARQPTIYFKTEKANGLVCLQVQDNGVGFDMKRYGKKIFKPFERVSPSKNGLGVGLHIVKTIVEKNGGKIEVQSQPNQGTTFTLYLMPYTHEEKNTAY